MKAQISSFNKFLTTQLNEQQKKAVTQTNGSLLVIAGAGSGKTRVITARIAHLILNENISSSSIIALTFTNKAAQEMKERIAHFLGNNQHIPFVGTFHSYCLRLLKTHSHLLSQPFLSILDADDQQKLLSTIINRVGLSKKITAKQAQYQISHIKNQTSEAFSDATNPLLEQIYQAYEAEKKASRCLDFDDLLLEGLALFKKNPDFRESFQQEIRHILVDEYQDTNVIQHDFLKNIALNKKKKFNVDSICVVGDEDQSIYSWRGATVTNIIHFTKDFPDTSLIKIEQNYRSVQPILEIANHVIAHNKQRNPKTLWSDRKGSDRIRTITCLSEYQEGEAIAQFLRIATRQNKIESPAILYRAHYQSRALEEALIKHSIPYKIIGGVQFYERKEIKDIFAYLRLMVNPFDRASFFRVINCPARGLGEKFEQLFYTRWHQEPFLPFSAVAQKLLEEGLVAGTKKTSLKQFVQLFEKTSPHEKPSVVADHFLRATSYIDYLKNGFDPEDAQSRIENIKELMHALTHFESQGIDTITRLLDEVALMQEKQTAEQETSTPVLLMTLHAAKGLEFDTVILTGLEEGILPSSRSLHDPAALEEERRLFYVGITRAQERLLLSHCRFRYTFGSMSDQLSSRFLDEIPDTLAARSDCSYTNPTNLQQFFSDWLGVTGRSSSVQTFSTAISAKKTVAEPAKTPEHFKKSQTVVHAKFGTGIVQSVEKKGDITIAEVKFKTGTKKIATQFLQTV